MGVAEDMVTAMVKRIRIEAQICEYDGRPHLLPNDYDLNWKTGEKFRRGYMCVKYAVSRVLQPKSICEIGVCSGIGALAMLEGSPTARYIGIDNLQEEKLRGISLVKPALGKMKALGYNASLVVADSQELTELPYGPFDLIHVDGCHTREAARHDVTLAYHVLSWRGWILVDDGRDAFVCAGTFEALANLPGGNIYWGYFEDTTGSILIHKERS